MKNYTPISFVMLAALLWMGCDNNAGSGTTGGVDTTKTDSVAPPPKVAPVFNSPEGAASDGQFLYVSNLGVEAAPSVKDGDGRIMKLNLEADDWVDKDKWATIKLDAPKGLAVIGKMLYVTDIDRLVCIDLKKTEVSSELSFARLGTTFLNDIAVKDDTTLLVSATDINSIFKVNLKTMKWDKMKAGELNGPNGLFYNSEDNKVYCVEYGSKGNPKGRILAIDYNSGAQRVIGKHTGGLDGLALGPKGELLFTDWGLSHLAMVGMGANDPLMQLGDSIHGPADFYFDTKTNRAFVPAMLDNALRIIPVQ